MCFTVLLVFLTWLTITVLHYIHCNTVTMGPSSISKKPPIILKRCYSTFGLAGKPATKYFYLCFYLKLSDYNGDGLTKRCGQHFTALFSNFYEIANNWCKISIKCLHNYLVISPRLQSNDSMWNKAENLNYKHTHTYIFI